MTGLVRASSEPLPSELGLQRAIAAEEKVTFRTNPRSGPFLCLAHCIPHRVGRSREGARHSSLAPSLFFDVTGSVFGFCNAGLVDHERGRVQRCPCPSLPSPSAERWGVVQTEAPQRVRIRGASLFPGGVHRCGASAFLSGLSPVCDKSGPLKVPRAWQASLPDWLPARQHLEAKGFRRPFVCPASGRFLISCPGLVRLQPAVPFLAPQRVQRIDIG